MNETQLTTNQRPQDPRVIEWESQQYMDSYDCHQDYLSDGDTRKAKYQRHDNFRQKIRTIESYSIYVDHKNIVILSWEQVKSGPTEILRRLQPYFKRVGYANLILLDATAQAALTHHLDNELSKQISVAINTQIGRQARGRDVLPIELAERAYKAALSIGRMMGCPDHIMHEFAVKRTLIDTEVNLEGLLPAAASMQKVEPEEIMLEPTALAEKLGLGKGNHAGARLNKMLASIDWQKRNYANTGWELRPAGEPHASTHPWMRNGKSGYNIKWRSEVVRNELQRRNMLPSNAAD